MTEQKIRSDLSDYEQYIYNLTTTGDENVIGIAKLEPKCENAKVLECNVIKKALYYMFKRHPLFRAVAKQTESSKCYLEINDELSESEDTMYYEYSEHYIDSDEADAIAIKEFEIFLSKSFDYENNCHLWRFKLISLVVDQKQRIYVFALILPLYITDGLNITVLCMELCNIINSIIGDKECEEMNVKLNLTENMHDLILKYGLLNNEVEKLINRERLVHFNFPCLFRKSENEEGGTKINLLKIDQNLTTEILRQSKERKIRLSGFLVTVALEAFKQLYDEFNILIPRDFSCLLPANLRFRMKPEVDLCDMRFFAVLISINLIYPFFNLENECIWENAKYVNKMIAEKTQFENGSLLQYSHNSKYIDEANRVFRELSVSKAPKELNRYNFCDFLISNLGTYASDRKKLIDGDYKLTEIYHGDCLLANPSYFSSFMLHVSTFNNQMMFQLSTNRNMFASEHADRFMAIFKTILQRSSQ